MHVCFPSIDVYLLIILLELKTTYVLYVELARATTRATTRGQGAKSLAAACHRWSGCPMKLKHKFSSRFWMCKVVQEIK